MVLSVRLLGRLRHRLGAMEAEVAIAGRNLGPWVFPAPLHPRPTGADQLDERAHHVAIELPASRVLAPEDSSSSMRVGG